MKFIISSYYVIKVKNLEIFIEKIEHMFYNAVYNLANCREGHFI